MSAPSGKRSRRPNTQTIRRVFKWLADNQMGVYGPNADVETGIVYGANRDFNADDAIKLAQHVKKGTLVDEES